jgi:hypothetical protein
MIPQHFPLYATISNLPAGKATVYAVVGWDGQYEQPFGVPLGLRVGNIVTQLEPSDAVRYWAKYEDARSFAD